MRISPLTMVVAVVVSTSSATALPPSIVIQSDPADVYIDANGAIGSFPRGRVGTGGDDFAIFAENLVFFFPLPSLAPGQSIATADLAFNYVELRDNPEFNADLYGIGWIHNPPTYNANWFFNGALDTRTGNTLETNLGNSSVQKLQDNVMVTSMPLGIVHTNAGGDAQLATFLQSLYAHGAHGGDFALLRLNPDNLMPPTDFRRGYTVEFAEGSMPPVLTLTTVPEPATLAMAVVGALFLTYARSFLGVRPMRHTRKNFLPRTGIS